MSLREFPPAPSRQAVVPEGALSFPVKSVQDTRWFGFLLLPEFTLLAFSSALEPLRIANQLAQRPLYGWLVVSEDGRAVPSSSGVDINVHAPLSDLTDVTRLFVCSGNKGIEAASDKVVAKIREHVRFGGKVGGICTGAATLARAGLLKERQFTLHWENQPGFVEVFPDLKPTRNRFEEDGGIVTCGGGSSATEMMLSVIAQDYGQEFSVVVADMCLNDPDLSRRREQRSSIAKAIDSRNPKLLNAIQTMYVHIENPLTLDEIAESAGLSRRQLERHFRNLLLETPAVVYRNIRLERARALMIDSDLSVLEVAIACGFGSSKTFSRQFKNRYGVTPFGLRGR